MKTSSPFFRSAFGLVISALFSISGCGGADMSTSTGGGYGGGSAGGGSYGATPGGAQDFRYVRKLIAQGQVPSESLFFVEGLLSEHDLPIAGKACKELLCVRLATSVALDVPQIANEGETVSEPVRRTYVQVGFGSGLSEDTFRRAPLDLALVVDVSGSMGTSKMNAAKHALRELVKKLSANDRVSLIRFNDRASVLLAPTAGDRTQTLIQAIDTLHSGGGTNIEAGIRLGREQIKSVRADGGGDDVVRSRRLMLFTDAMPNVGATGPMSFVSIVEAMAGEDKIGLTAFGVGIDFNAKLIDTISNLRGGNYFYLADEKAIREIFDKDFDFLVTPLAYDLELKLHIPPGFKMVAAYGIKDWQVGSADHVLKVPTIFLSRNKGAIVVALERDENASASSSMLDVFGANLKYELVDGSIVKDTLSSEVPARVFDSGEQAYHGQDGVRKAVALVKLAVSMRRA